MPLSVYSNDKLDGFFGAPARIFFDDCKRITSVGHSSMMAE
jgi:hypothetical protein